MISDPELTTFATGPGAMIDIFVLGYEMQAWKQRFVRKVRVVVEGLDHATTSTRQDGGHASGDFREPANTSDVVGHVLVHVDGGWNRPGLQTLNKGRMLVVIREVAGGRVTAFR